MLVVYSKIIGTGSYHPKEVLTNDQLSQMVDTSDEWIRTRSGIVTRRRAGRFETNATMGAKALKKALEDAGRTVEDLDLIVVGTNTNRHRWGSCATKIHRYLKVPKNCGAFDIQAGCTGFAYALTTTDAYMRSGVARVDRGDKKRCIAAIGTDKLTELVDWTDRETCILFGDLASAFILEESDEEGLIKHVLGEIGRAHV